MTNQLFPELRGKRFLLIDFDKEARQRQSRIPQLISTRHENPFLDPELCGEFAKALALELGTDFTYGGYLEDRSFLWRKSYLELEKNYLHLGVDFNVPTGIAVSCLFDGSVVCVDEDYPFDGGWGPRVIVRPDNGGPDCVFAHLQDVKVSAGQQVKSGAIIAQVGQAPRNGNWYPHLHMQTVARPVMDNLIKTDLSQMDGYGHEAARDELQKSYPNPLQYHWLVGDRFAVKD